MKNNVKKYREEKNMSQSELAKNSNVSRTTISNLENNKAITITNITMEKIAKVLEKSVAEIFFE